MASNRFKKAIIKNTYAKFTWITN